MTMHAIIQKFQPISLEEMGGIRLMNRTDTKFVTTIDKLQALLVKVEVGGIDFLRDMSVMKVFYRSESVSTVDGNLKMHAEEYL